MISKLTKKVFAALCLLAMPLSAANADSAHQFAFVSIDGSPLPLAAFSGKAVLVVNTASRCGFTRQYNGLQSLWETYRDQGLIVLGVPSNDFGRQEPGSNEEIKEFCEVNFGIDFPMTEKVSVKGDDAHAFYVLARETLGAQTAPRWNFHKYLVAPDGSLKAWFSSSVEPMSKTVRQSVESVLP